MVQASQTAIGSHHSIDTSHSLRPDPPWKAWERTHSRVPFLRRQVTNRDSHYSKRQDVAWSCRVASANSERHLPCGHRAGSAPAAAPRLFFFWQQPPPQQAGSQQGL